MCLGGKIIPADCWSYGEDLCVLLYGGNVIKVEFRANLFANSVSISHTKDTTSDIFLIAQIGKSQEC